MLPICIGTIDEGNLYRFDSGPSFRRGAISPTDGTLINDQHEYLARICLTKGGNPCPWHQRQQIAIE